MKLFLLAIVALPCFGQFTSMEITFEGIGCASCEESLPARVKRMRGVESAELDAPHGVLKVKLAEQNRVRVEQVRDMIEQDGTKAKKAVVRVKGELSEQGGKWLLQPAGVPTTYEIAGAKAAGTYIVSGEIKVLRPDSGTLVIAASDLQKAPS